MSDDEFVEYEDIRIEACKGATLKDALLLADGRKAALKLDGYTQTIRMAASELSTWARVGGAPGNPNFEEEGAIARERVVVLVMGEPRKIG